LNKFKLLALLAVALVTPHAFADDDERPPELRLPKQFAPVKMEFYAKASDVVDWDKAMMGFPAAWKANQGENVVAYVYDTGINLKHPEFASVAERIEEVDFTGEGPGDENGHGSHVASTIFGQKDVSGGARKLKKLVAMKVLGRRGNGDFAMMERAIRWAIADMKKHGLPSVHSASLGTKPDPVTPPSQFDRRLYKAVQDSIAAGAVWCVAAGNDGPAANTVGFPARYGEDMPLIVVAACNRVRQISQFSSRGRAVYVTAPGEEIIGAGLGNDYYSWKGTSMATPGIAGGICCYLSAAAKGMKPEERQQKTADWLRTVCSFPQERNVSRGYGLPDFGKITELVKTPPPDTPTQPPPAEKVYVIDAAKLKAEGYTSVRFDLGGGQAQAVPVRAAEPIAPQCGPGGCPPQLAPPQFAAPAVTFSGPGTVFQGFSPPPPVYQPMPSCGPGGCRPQQPQYLFAPFGGAFRR
jgi:subtilisin family serine protease